MARTMLENLSVGINPITGRALPASDNYANEVVQEALKTVLEHCSLESYASLLERQKKEKKAAAIERKKRNAIQYPDGGAIWTKEDNVLLRNLHLSKKVSFGREHVY